jgi:hypothetical protein
VLKTALAANSLVREKLFSDNELTAYIPQHLTEKKAIVRGVDTKLTESQLTTLIESEVPVLGVRRMTRLVEQDGEKIKIPRQTIVVTFAGLSVPKAVTINYIKCPTELYIPKVVQCLNCLRFGHISSQCNSKSRCKTCGKEHVAESECSRVKFCVYCETFDHSSTAKDCPYHQKQFAIKKVMIENNLTFLEAKQRLENPSFATVTKTQTRTPFLNSEPPSGLNELFPSLPTRKAKPSLTQNTSSRNIQHNHPFNPTKRKKIENNSEPLPTGPSRTNFAGQPITNNPFAVSEIEKLKTILHKGVMDSIRTSFTGKDLEGTINSARGWKICTKKWPKYACKYALKREKICIYICIYALKYAVNWSFSLITHDKNQNSFLLFIYLHMFIYKLKRNY